MSGPVGDSEIGAVAEALPPAEAVRFLIDVANLRGGPDNISAIVARIPRPDGAPPPTPLPVPSQLDQLLRSGWPVLLLLGGSALAALATYLSLERLGGALPVFILATLIISGGLVGLLIHARRVKAKQAYQDQTEGDGELRIYRHTNCFIDRTLLENWLKAETILLTRVREQKCTIDWPGYEAEHERAMQARKHNDYYAAFTALCRAMQRLIKGLNELRAKGEVFQPVWDKKA